MYLSRSEYDALAFEEAVRRGEVNPEDQGSVDRWRERRYPISTDAAKAELENRGLLVGDFALAQFARDNCRKIGGSAAWYASDIDAIAAERFAKPRVRRAHELWLGVAKKMDARRRKSVV